MAEQKNAQNVDVNQLLKVRREKLQDLQERGKDPFQITKYDMTHHSISYQFWCRSKHNFGYRYAGQTG